MPEPSSELRSGVGLVRTTDDAAEGNEARRGKGVVIGVHLLSPGSIRNTGTIGAVNYGYAVGVGSGTIFNSGLITGVSAGRGIGASDLVTITNTGTIVVGQANFGAIGVLMNGGGLLTNRIRPARAA